MPDDVNEPSRAEVVRAADAIVDAVATTDTTVDTTVTTSDGTEPYREGESIIFRPLCEGSLLAIHEHLSTLPDSAGSETTDVESESTDVEPTGAEAVAQ